MTLKEMNLNVFARQPNPHVFFQPRIEPWFNYNKDRGQVSPRLAAMDTVGFYDDLGVSMRYIHYYTGMPDPIEQRTDPSVRQRWDKKDGSTFHVIETPFGDLTQESQFTSDQTWRTVKFFIEAPEDWVRFRWFIERTTFHFDQEKFDLGAANLGDRGEPCFWVPKSPFQAMLQTWSTLEHTVYSMDDDPAPIEAAMTALDASYDPLYEELARAQGLHILNFGENIHAQLFSPKLLEKYYLPFWEKRCGQLRKAGLYTHAHFDGYYKPLLKYLAKLPFDGIEALTPTPQGDVTLEETKAFIGDKILLDGIPALLFMPFYKDEDLYRCVEQVVKLFHPRLVLGISDEFPEGAPESCLERVRWIKSFCEGKK